MSNKSSRDKRRYRREVFAIDPAKTPIIQTDHSAAELRLYEYFAKQAQKGTNPKLLEAVQKTLEERR